MAHVVIVVTKNNALVVIVDGTKNEELANVHVVATRALGICTSIFEVAPSIQQETLVDGCQEQASLLSHPFF